MPFRPAFQIITNYSSCSQVLPALHGCQDRAPLVGKFLPCGQAISAPLPSESISTNASHSGWGAACGSRHLSGHWVAEHAWHISLLKLQAILLAISHWALLLRGKVVSIHSNNKTAVACLLKEVGTRSLRLMGITCHLLAVVDHWGIVSRPCYVPGIANVEANALSHDQQEVAWCILPEVASPLF